MMRRVASPHIHTRPMVRLMAHHETKSAFQLKPNGPDVSLMDLETAFELCENITEKDARQACYIVFGVDSEAMKNYYPVVAKMEKMLYPEEASFVSELLKKFNLQK